MRGELYNGLAFVKATRSDIGAIDTVFSCAEVLMARRRARVSMPLGASFTTWWEKFASMRSERSEALVTRFYEEGGRSVMAVCFKPEVWRPRQELETNLQLLLRRYRERFPQQANSPAVRAYTATLPKLARFLLGRTLRFEANALCPYFTDVDLAMGKHLQDRNRLLENHRASVSAMLAGIADSLGISPKLMGKICWGRTA